MQYLKYIILE